MNQSHITLKSYVIGFILSIVFTMSAYFVATSPTLTSKFVLTFIIILAFLQFITQLIFFLHLGTETKPRWNQFIFFTTIIGIGILVGGSIWIMNHLNYNMTPQDMSSYLLKDEGIQP
jgi:cytochrome o ubiquinol oxidase operon protein cyoD